MLIKYTESVEIENEVDIEFPYYISYYGIYTVVYESLNYVEIYKETFEDYTSYELRRGKNFQFFAPFVENQNQNDNLRLFNTAILEYKSLLHKF